MLARKRIVRLLTKREVVWKKNKKFFFPELEFEGSGVELLKTIATIGQEERVDLIEELPKFSTKNACQVIPLIKNIPKEERKRFFEAFWNFLENSEESSEPLFYDPFLLLFNGYDPREELGASLLALEISLFGQNLEHKSKKFLLEEAIHGSYTSLFARSYSKILGKPRRSRCWTSRAFYGALSS